MNFKEKINSKEEFRLLISCIFKGMSNTQIANKLSYSRSAVAYKLKMIFKTFNAANRIDFIVRILGEIIKTKKMQLYQQSKQQEIINKENKKLKKLIKEISIKQENKKELQHLLSEAKKL